MGFQDEQNHIRGPTNKTQNHTATQEESIICMIIWQAFHGLGYEIFTITYLEEKRKRERGIKMKKIIHESVWTWRQPINTYCFIKLASLDQISCLTHKIHLFRVCERPRSKKENLTNWSDLAVYQKTAQPIKFEDWTSYNESSIFLSSPNKCEGLI